MSDYPQKRLPGSGWSWADAERAIEATPTGICLGKVGCVLAYVGGFLGIFLMVVSSDLVIICSAPLVLAGLVVSIVAKGKSKAVGRRNPFASLGISVSFGGICLCVAQLAGFPEIMLGNW